MRMAITLQESLRAVFYAPFYLALAQHAFEQEGVEIQFVSAPSPGEAGREVMNGAVDVSWGGPMRVMETYELDPACDLVCFAEVVTRDPFLLVGRAATGVQSCRAADVARGHRQRGSDAVVVPAARPTSGGRRSRHRQPGHAPHDGRELRGPRGRDA